MATSTLELKEGKRESWPILRALVPSVQVRFTLALLFTFFPFGILYPARWPIRELITLVSWQCVFPSIPGLLCLGLLPLLPNGTYGYWAFNLICFVLTLATAYSVATREAFHQNVVTGLLKFVRACVVLTFVIGICQIFSRPEAWSAVFDEMSLGDGGRGAGLLSEPSLLAAPLAIYLSLLASRMEGTSSRGSAPAKKKFVLEALLVIIGMLAMTRSISVLIVAICFAPFLGLRLRRPLLAILGLAAGALVAVQVFGERISEAVEEKSSTVLDIISIGLGSWRNIPDLAIVLNFRDFLLPGPAGEVRDKINFFAAGLSPVFAWIENTYSTFSAGASTLGLIAVILLFVAGIAIGVRNLPSGAVRLTWVMLYVANWFVTPKYDAAGWVALGLLLLMYRPALEKSVFETKRYG